MRAPNRAQQASALVTLVLAAGIAACSGTDAAQDAPSPHASRSNTDVVALARDQALSAYKAMWEDFVVASETSDYKSPRLALHADGDALALLVHGLKFDHDRGVVATGRPTFDPAITKLTPTTLPTKAVIQDCSSGKNWLAVHAKTGKPATDLDSSPGWHKVDATVTKQGLRSFHPESAGSGAGVVGSGGTHAGQGR